MSDLLQKIHDYSLEEIMGLRFGTYSKYIIQDRAIPDVRDGLKPVQRRILYAMHKSRYTHDKPFNKSAKTVGIVVGNYHPHGDGSVYEAMIRMSQDWKQRNPYIEIHGNNGSIDGDSAAAMRYTEARLTKISGELLRDIEKNCVAFAPNYDDKDVEPTVLPARFPNLLVNGATGISAGYATNIPPHNLGEIIDATIHLIKKPDATLNRLLKIVKGPDFPMGGIAMGEEGIRKAYETGKGKFVIKSKVEVTKKAIIVTELPHDVNKANLVRKIDEIRIDKKVEGISEVRDESSREGLRIAIDLKSGADSDIVLKYLLKNTDLQTSYSFNMVVIVNRRPKLLGLIPILKAYIDHQREVTILKTKFDLEHARARLHIVEGLIKALGILDEVIKTIRASKNKTDAIANLEKEFKFTHKQADAIVMLQLYKLTNTDVGELEAEYEKLLKIIKGLTTILENEDVLHELMIRDLKTVKELYPTPRRTEIVERIEEIKIDATKLIPKEETVVAVTNDGYIKRISNRSFSASPEIGLKEGDFLTGLYRMNTLNVILLFTNLGNFLYVPVHEIPEAKAKDLGTHISNIITLSPGETVVGNIPVTEFDKNKRIITYTKLGMIKQTSLDSFVVTRYSKPIGAMKLKADDEMVGAYLVNSEQLMVITEKGYGLVYTTEEVPITGLKTSGVKSINLKDDLVVKILDYNEDVNLTLITDKNTGKRVRGNEFSLTSRAKRGVQLIREVKTNPHLIRYAFMNDEGRELNYYVGHELKVVKYSELPIVDRYSTGTNISKLEIDSVFEPITLIDLNSKAPKKEPKQLEEPVTVEELDKRLMTIDDFLGKVDK